MAQTLVSGPSMLDTLGLALHGCLCLGPGLVLLLVAWATLRCCRSTSGKRHQVGGRLQASLSQEAWQGRGAGDSGGSHCTGGWDTRPLGGLSWGQAHWGSALCQQVCDGSRGRGRRSKVHETGRALLGPGAGSCRRRGPLGPRCRPGLGHIQAAGSRAPPSEASRPPGPGAGPVPADTCSRRSVSPISCRC